MSRLSFLVRAGADVNAADADGVVPLHRAVRVELGDFFNVLLAQEEVDVHRAAPRVGTPLHTACTALNLSAILALLEKQADLHSKFPDIVSSTPLVAALAYSFGREDAKIKADQVVRALVHNGVNVQETIPGAFSTAQYSQRAWARPAGTLNFLLDEGASPEVVDPVPQRLPHHLARRQRYRKT